MRAKSGLGHKRCRPLAPMSTFSLPSIAPLHHSLAVTSGFHLAPSIFSLDLQATSGWSQLEAVLRRTKNTPAAGSRPTGLTRETSTSTSFAESNRTGNWLKDGKALWKPPQGSEPFADLAHESDMGMHQRWCVHGRPRVKSHGCWTQRRFKRGWNTCGTTASAGWRKQNTLSSDGTSLLWLHRTEHMTCHNPNDEQTALPGTGRVHRECLQKQHPGSWRLWRGPHDGLSGLKRPTTVDRGATDQVEGQHTE